MSEMDKNQDTLIKELIYGIIVFGVVAQTLLIVFSDMLMFRTIGLWIGIMTASGMAIHMKRSIEDALDMGEAGALTHIRKTYIIRVLVIAIIFCVVYFLKIGSVLTAFIGIMGLKISAYLQPHMHKIYVRFQKSK